MGIRVPITTVGSVPLTLSAPNQYHRRRQEMKCRNRKVTDEPISVDTANAATAGAGCGRAQRRDDGIADLRHRRSDLRASTKLHRENGAGDRCALGAGQEGRRYHCLWDQSANDVEVV